MVETVVLEEVVLNRDVVPGAVVTFSSVKGPVLVWLEVVVWVVMMVLICVVWCCFPAGCVACNVVSFRASSVTLMTDHMTTVNGIVPVHRPKDRSDCV